MKKNNEPKATDNKPEAELIGNSVPPLFTDADIERLGKRAGDGVILAPETTVVCDNTPTPIDPIIIMDYLVVDCLPGIGRHFYLGDDLVHLNENTTPVELIETGIDLYGEGPDAVLPGFKAKIETLLGEGNFKFVCWEMGQEHLTLNWLVNIDVYDEAVELISHWLWYEEICDIVSVGWRP